MLEYLFTHLYWIPSAIQFTTLVKVYLNMHVNMHKLVVEIWECKLGLDAIVDLVQLTQLSFNFSPLSTRVPKTLAPENMRKAVIFNILNIFKCIEGELLALDITRKEWNYLDIMTFLSNKICNGPHYTRHLAPVSVLLSGSCHLIHYLSA